MYKPFKRTIYTNAEVYQQLILLMAFGPCFLMVYLHAPSFALASHCVFAPLRDFRGRIFSRVGPFYEQAVSNPDT
jgi:hypothetical protein